MRIPGSEAIRTQIQPSKQKREMIKVTNIQNIKETYGQPSKQLFPKGWSLSNPNRTKNNMHTRKVKHYRNSDKKQATVNQNKTTALERSVINCRGA